jgi:acrylyl-CoA reductase (NADPH)
MALHDDWTLMTFRAIYLEKDAGGTTAHVRELEEHDLPDQGDVTVDVAYSTINYKDALAITGRSPVVRRFPMVAGIDLAGTVVDSQNPDWRAGDPVIVNGWEIGEKYWGGLAQRARVRGEWLIRKPEDLTLYDAMAIGTAGYTAALSVMAIERHGTTPEHGEVLVTGATGGVGSIAILMLAAQGYHVVASTGKQHEADYLRRLGAAAVIDRASLSQPGKPLQTERWAAAVDAAGSNTLVNVCASTKYDGIVAACGLAQGMDFPGTVAPFILRGVTLAGINSVLTPVARRRAAWTTIERLVDRAKLRSLSREIGLEEAIAASPTLLAGAVTGRLVVNVAK